MRLFLLCPCNSIRIRTRYVKLCVRYFRDESKSSMDCRVYAFNMTSLVDHLRRQAEQNKTASYFNIDIVKYQVSLH
jgi:hypothetical protein